MSHSKRSLDYISITCNNIKYTFEDTRLGISGWSDEENKRLRLNVMYSTMEQSDILYLKTRLNDFIDRKDIIMNITDEMSYVDDIVYDVPEPVIAILSKMSIGPYKNMVVSCD